MSTLFPRNQSGFVQELTTRDLFVINMIGAAVGFGVTAAPSFMAAQYPNANIVVTLLTTLVFAVFNGLLYGEFASLMPRSGGDYIYTSRVLNPFCGFIGSWGFAWSQALGVGIYCVWFITNALVPSLETIAQTTSAPMYSQLAKTLSSDTLSIATGTAVVIISVVLVSLAGIRFLSRILGWLMSFAAFGTLVLCYVLWTTSQEDMHLALTAHLANINASVKSPGALVDLALTRDLIRPYKHNWFDSLLAIPVGYWMIVGFTYSAYLGGEVRSSRGRQIFAILSCLFVTIGLYLLILSRYYHLIGHDLINATTALQGSPEGMFFANGSVSFFAAVAAKSYWQKVVVSLSVALWYYLLPFVMFQACVRHMFCWSFDGIIPEKFAQVNERGAPHISLVFLGVCSFMFSLAFLFKKLDFFNYIVLFSVCFILTGIAAIKGANNSFAGLANHILDPKEIARRCRVIRIAGIGNTILFIGVIATAYYRPSFALVNAEASRSLEVYLLLFIYVSGAILYTLRQHKSNNRFRVLPPA